MTYRAVVFDFDLTLADSTVGAIMCVNYALGKLGIPLASPQRIAESIGLSMSDTLEFVAGVHGSELVRQFTAHFIERADEVMVENTVLFAEVPQVMQQLKSQGVLLGIVSSKFRYRIETILMREGLGDTFSVLLGREDAANHKPDPSGLLMALSQLQCMPDEALYVGDHQVDAEAARRADMAFVGVLTGHTSAVDFKDCGALAVIENLSLLPGLLDGHLRQTGT